MPDGILFDNILIVRNEKVAESYRAETLKPKYEIEKEKQKAEDASASASSDVLSDFQKKVFDVLYKIADIPFLEAYKNQIIDVIEKAEKQPILTVGVLVSIVVVLATAILRLLFGRRKPQAPASPTTETKNAGGTDALGNSEEREENAKDDASAPRSRRTRRET